MAYGFYRLFYGIREKKYVCCVCLPSNVLDLSFKTIYPPGSQVDNIALTTGFLETIASLHVRRFGLAFTSSPSSKPKRTAIKSADTMQRKPVRRSYLEGRRRFTIAIGMLYPFLFLFWLIS